MTARVEQRHAWFPSSPCDASCTRPTSTPVSRARRLVRLTTLLAVVALFVATAPFGAVTPRPVRRRYLRAVSRMLLRALGIRIIVDDRRPFPARARGLVVANHVSFLDVLAIGAVSPAHFVAKSDVLQMGPVSVVARILGVITVERGSLRQLPGTLDTVVDALNRDTSVAVFPEGTTWCGRSSGRFRPAFFQAAIDAAVPILPMSLTYAGDDGNLCSAAAFIGDDEVGDTMARVVAQRAMTVTVTVHEVQLPVPDRRYLAALCEQLILGTPVALHADMIVTTAAA